jgi:hypothetical protein
MDGKWQKLVVNYQLQQQAVEWARQSVYVDSNNLPADMRVLYHQVLFKDFRGGSAPHPWEDDIIRLPWEGQGPLALQHRDIQNRLVSAAEYLCVDPVTGKSPYRIKAIPVTAVQADNLQEAVEKALQELR